MRIPKYKDIENWKVTKQIVNLCHTNIIVKIFSVFIIWVIALIPTEFYLLIRWGVGPDGFWQELALFTLFIFLIGWLQLILGIFAIALSLALISDVML